MEATYEFSAFAHLTKKLCYTALMGTWLDYHMTYHYVELNGTLKTTNNQRSAILPARQTCRGQGRPRIENITRSVGDVVIWGTRHDNEFADGPQGCKPSLYFQEFSTTRANISSIKKA